MPISENKQKKIDSFDVNGVGLQNGQLFGLPFSFEESEVALLPVPWEVTVSYSPGTAKGPAAMLEASLQVDLYDPDVPDAWKRGFYMLAVSTEWAQKSKQYRARVSEYIRLLEMGKTEGHEAIRNTINEESDQLRKWVFEQCTALLDQGKLTGLIGGDHSTPLGFMQALSIRHASFGILQIDAHADLRKAYEGFTYSHASIMHNALDIPQVSSLVQLGLRDVCQEEMDRIISDDRIHAFFYQDIQAARYEGQSWKQACEGIISKLPEEVYISFDIDGLDPKLCPNTGTPVAGGFEMSEIIFLLQELVRSGRRIIGFDLVEVAPGADEWDANVGVRLLYKLCNLMVKSNGR